MFRRLCCLVAVAAVASAYSVPKPALNRDAARRKSAAQQAFAAAASASLAFVLAGSPLSSDATSDTAAQISLNSLPPNAVKVEGVPIVGGTYTKVYDSDVPSPGLVINLPKDKIGALKSLLGGHLEVDVGGVLAAHADVDLASEAGVLTAKVYNPLIPKLPFKNSASGDGGDSGGGKATGKASDWSSVTNLGDGDVYYFNAKTSVTTFEKPSAI